MAKTSTMRRRLAPHTLHAQASAGVLPGLWDIGRVAEMDGRGPLGESLLHWAMLRGRADWAVEWALRGGSYSPDGAGSSPLHWLARGDVDLFQDRHLRLWRHPGFAEEFGPRVCETDAMGRDFAGLLCLQRAGGALRALAQAGAAPRTASLGRGGCLGLADAMMACGLALDDDGPQAERTWAAEASRLSAPSSRLPEGLRFEGGFWTQAMWDAALLALATDEQLARMSARDISMSLDDQAPLASMRPSRI